MAKSLLHLQQMVADGLEIRQDRPEQLFAMRTGLGSGESNS